MTSLSISIDFLKSTIDDYDFKERPLIVGLSGPQGSGKSYLAEHLLSNLKTLYPHLNIVQFSMDDLYLTHEEQSQLNEVAKTKLLNNGLLQGRGLPGTHDIALGLQIFQQLIESKSNGSRHLPVKIPLYDKSAFHGEGDRYDISKWQVIEKPIDIILFEGWFNGFEPLDSDQLKLSYFTSDPSEILQRHKLFHLEEINQTLKDYSKVWRLFDKFIFINTSNIDNVYTWRIQQEHALIKATGKGMSDDKVVKFVDRYMPMYKLYYDRMCDAGAVKAPNSNLKLSIDISRNVLSHQLL
ncbi:P-loop containing nucleoside triphosphate hydrolase protein [Scheffersomyces coipomensis]|uniref:P-loop containing nucleoside triphosphate hydrolase protein n=1 Tax=Scheffersomyces coipomensis TaxID=1788519 RepID=UPI00315C5D5B